MTARIEVDRITKRYVTHSRDVVAVDNVSLSLAAGESVGVVGESGSGKSTLARMITHFEKPDEGRILVNGVDIFERGGMSRKQLYSAVQMVFQNPLDSFNPYRKIGALLAETARNFGTPRSQVSDKVKQAIASVGLREECLDRYRHQISGGECQRAAIARALLSEPSFLVLDEVTSALDVSVQAQIIELIRNLNREKGIGLLFISHDLAVVSIVCDRVLVMNQGKVVEEGSCSDVLVNPAHPYTQLLLDSVYSTDIAEPVANGAEGRA